MTDTEAKSESESASSVEQVELFLLDAMLGSLSTYLRMCGHDAVYVLDTNADTNTNTNTNADYQTEQDADAAVSVEDANDDSNFLSRDREPTDDEILTYARNNERTILTRDTELANRADDAVLLTARDVEDQLRELAAVGYDLTLTSRPSRCGACNGRVERLSSDVVVPEYAPDPSERDCWQCLICEQIFWKGSHWDDVAATLERVRSQ